MTKGPRTRCSISLHHRCVLLAMSLSIGACMTAPLNGSTDSTANLIGHAITYAGFHNVPGMAVTVQVLHDPETQDPNVSANWDTIATGATETTPFVWHDPSDPLYSWSITATPVPTTNQALRWPQGGVQRVRALANGQMLTVFDQDFFNCVGEHQSESWESIGVHCASSTASATPNGTANVATMLSTSPDLADTLVSGARGHLLNKKQCLSDEKTRGPDSQHCTSATDPAGTITQADIIQYYKTISAPTSLNCFRTIFGFGGNGNIFDCGTPWLSPNNDLAEAIYYNKGDLGVGRYMHCRSFVSNNLGGNRFGVACYVNNYSTQTDSYSTPKFAVDPQGAIELAVNDKHAGNEAHAFATVAMVYLTPNSSTDPNAVRFMVYDASGALSTEAKLDESGFNTAVPTNCMVCHGGNSQFSATASSVTGARFLPFDMHAFEFSPTLPEAESSTQIDAFRALNNFVLKTNPPAAEGDLIRGWYGGNMVSGTPDFNYVPTGFSGTSTGTRVYREVVKPYCRTCHISQDSDRLATFNDMLTNKALIKIAVCDNKTMPQAEQPLRKLWTGSGRAHLIGGLNLITSCKP